MNLSIVIATRNRPESLRRLTTALATQRGAPDAECIVVDDGSRAADAVREAAGGARILRLDPPRGVCVARNAGIAAATGDVLCFFDDDIIPDAGYLARCRQVHEEHPEVLVLNGLQRPARSDLYAQYWHYYYAAAFNRADAGPLYPVERISPGTLSIKRALLDRVDPLFDPAVEPREDFNLWWLLHDLGIPVYKSDELTAKHDYRASLLSFLNARLWYQRGETALRRKHGAEKVAAEEARLLPPNRLRFLPLQLLVRIWLHIHGVRA